MVPSLNYFNSNRDYQTYYKWDNELKGFVMKAFRKIECGEEINLQAESPNNDYFLIKKGFVHPMRRNRIVMTGQLH
mgnify:CR=1 FL=1